MEALQPAELKSDFGFYVVPRHNETPRAMLEGTTLPSLANLSPTLPAESLLRTAIHTLRIAHDASAWVN